MSTIAAAALGNAKMRTQLGWPLMLLTIALYAPLGGLPRLALIATGLFFLAQQTPRAGAPDKSGKAPTKQPATPRSTQKRQPARTTTAKPQPAAKTSRPRTASGRWTR